MLGLPDTKDAHLEEDLALATVYVSIAGQIMCYVVKSQMGQTGTGNMFCSKTPCSKLRPPNRTLEGYIQASQAADSEAPTPCNTEHGTLTLHCSSTPKRGYQQNNMNSWYEPLLFSCFSLLVCWFCSWLAGGLQGR